MGWNTVNNKPPPPKRPLSAFFLFKIDVFEQVKESNPESMIVEIFKIIAERWKNLDETTKLEYEKRQEQNKAKYEQEVKEYVEKYGPIEKRRRKPKRRDDSEDDSEDEGGKHNSGNEQEEFAQKNNFLVKHNTNNLRPPKKPLPPFFLYKQAKYEEVKKANPDAKITQITMIISEMWKGLDEVTKKEYEKLHDQHVANYEKELKEYQEAMNTPLNVPKGIAKSTKSNKKDQGKEEESASDSEEELEEPTKKKKKTFSE